MATDLLSPKAGLIAGAQSLLKTDSGHVLCF